MSQPRPPRVGPWRRLAALVASVAVLGGACLSGDDPVINPDSEVTPTSGSVSGSGDRPSSGEVSVGVFDEPDPTLGTNAGRAVRSLIYPSLFEVHPDGTWAPSLVEPGSVTDGTDGHSVTFRFRDGAVWSDGRAITVGDLERTANDRIVASIEGPAADGAIRVTFTRPVAGWQRLWSGDDAISPPGAEVFGGPFVLASRTEGLEAVLEPNDRWWGAGPFIERLRLVVVPDQTTLGELFDRGELDVIMPLPATELDEALDEIDGVSDQSAGGGWWYGLVLNPDEMDRDQRRALVASVERLDFVNALLREEAELLDSLASVTGPLRAGAWTGVDAGDVSALRGQREMQLTSMLEVPMGGLLARSMQRRLRDGSIEIELRRAESPIVAGWLAADEFDAALVLDVLDPLPCWTCLVDDLYNGSPSDGVVAAARAAEAGDAAGVDRVESTLAGDGVLLPIWRPHLRVAWRPPLVGPTANGWARSAAWNAADWYIDSTE